MLNRKKIRQSETNFQQDFIPAKWAKNPHLQTVLPRLIRRKPLFEPIWQRIETPDGDFLDLCWTEMPTKTKPIVLLFHGLAGCFYSPYANGLLNAFKQQGWIGVLMHFRGCSGQINRKAKSYHSGDTLDARFIIKLLHQKYQAPMAAVGVSLGGNMLAKYLEQYEHNPLLQASVAICPPLALASCSAKLQTGFSRFYQAYLLRLMQRSLNAKLLRHDKVGKISSKDKITFSSIYQFDELVTAPLHGFKDAKDYYEQCSGLAILNNISSPLKIIHALDDPFMTDAVIPNMPLPSNIHYHQTQYGGHVGFIGGSLTKPEFWLEQEVPRWIKAVTGF